MKNLIKKYLSEEILASASVDPQVSPGTFLVGPRYKKGSYFNKLTDYKDIWHYDEGHWAWDKFQYTIPQDDIENYNETLKDENLKHLFPEDRWKNIWKRVTGKNIKNSTPWSSVGDGDDASAAGGDIGGDMAMGENKEVMKMDLIKKYLFESGMITGGYPDDGSTGPASDDDRPPGNIVWAPRYVRANYDNKLTPYNSIWRHDEEGRWTWDYFENATGMDDPDNYDDSLKTMKKLFPDDTWDAAWKHIRRKDVPDKQVDVRFDIKGQPYRTSQDVLGKHDDNTEVVDEVPKELEVSEMNLIGRIDRLLITDDFGIGNSDSRANKPYGNVGGDVGGASGGSTWPSGRPPLESGTGFAKPKKKKKKKGVVYESKVSDTILKQINAIDRFALASWGAKNYVSSDDSIQFDVKGSKFRGKVVITYDKAHDSYIIELGQIRKLEWKQKYMIKNVFAQDLVNVLDQQIG